MPEVKFYSYQGRHNVAVKSLGSVVAHPTLNFVTNSRPQLTMDIECSEVYKANYCTFDIPVNSVPATVVTKKTYWFIDSIESSKNIFIYHLSLDFLATYWDDIKNSVQMIERSSSITPNCYMVDTLWKTGKKLSFNMMTTNSSSPFRTSDNSGTRKFYSLLTTTSNDASSTFGSLVDMVSAKGTMCYLLGKSDVATLLTYLWAGGLDRILEIWKNNPMDCIVAFNFFPFDIQEHTNASYLTTQQLYIGNISAEWPAGTDILFTSSSNTIVTLNVGTITCTRPFDDFRSIEPYASYKLWLPYIGLTDINMNDFFNYGSMTIKYYVNIITGETLVCLYTDTSVSPKLVLNGNIASRIPLSGADMGALFRDVSSTMASSFVSMIASSALGTVSGSASSVVHSRGQEVDKKYDSDNIRKLASKKVHAFDETDETESKFVRKSGMGTYRGAIAGTSFLSAYQKTPEVHTIGGYNGGSFRELNQKPYIMAYFPSTIDTSDTNQNIIYGRLVMQSSALKDLSGFVKVSNCTLPMKGMQYDVWEGMVRMLEEGFYVQDYDDADIVLPPSV